MYFLRKNWVKQNILSMRTGGNTFKVQVSLGLLEVRCFTVSCASTLQLSMRAVQLIGVEKHSSTHL